MSPAICFQAHYGATPHIYQFHIGLSGAPRHHTGQQTGRYRKLSPLLLLFHWALVDFTNYVLCSERYLCHLKCSSSIITDYLRFVFSVESWIISSVLKYVSGYLCAA